MPKVAIDYSKCVIYKIVCNDKSVTDIYVGSTTNFIKRRGEHKRLCINNKDYKIYNIINDHGGWNNWDMIQIEAYSCLNSQEAYARERELYDELNATMNMRRPYATNDEQKDYKKKVNKESCKQYYECNKETILDQRKEYYNINKNSIIETNKEYRMINKDKIKLSKQEYAKVNKEHIQQQRKEYYNLNKEAIKDKNKARYYAKKQQLNT
jgi:hypothetical protein